MNVLDKERKINQRNCLAKCIKSLKSLCLKSQLSGQYSMSHIIGLLLIKRLHLYELVCTACMCLCLVSLLLSHSINVQAGMSPFPMGWSVSDNS